MSSSISSVARQKGNEFFRSAAAGVAPVLRIERYQKAINHYHEALDGAVNAEERSSAYKNLAVTTHYIAILFSNNHDIPQSLFYFKDCLTNGNLAVSTGRGIMPEDWIEDILERLEEAFSDTFDFIMMSLNKHQRIKVLQRFSSVTSSRYQRVEMVKQLAEDYIQIADEALEADDYEESFRALKGVCTPFRKLEKFASGGIRDDALQDFINRLMRKGFWIISECQKKRELREQRELQVTRQDHLVELKPKLDGLSRNMDISIQKMLVWLYTEHPPNHSAKKFNVDIELISKASGDSLKKLLTKAIVDYHPDKIDTRAHGMEYKVWCEEIVKNLTRKYDMMKRA